MPTFTIKAEPLGGTDIKEAITEAIRLRELLGVNVEFDFNGITVFISNQTDVDSLVYRFHQCLKTKENFVL